MTSEDFDDVTLNRHTNALKKEVQKIKNENI